MVAGHCSVRDCMQMLGPASLVFWCSNVLMIMFYWTQTSPSVNREPYTRDQGRSGSGLRFYSANKSDQLDERKWTDFMCLCCALRCVVPLDLFYAQAHKPNIKGFALLLVGSNNVWISCLRCCPYLSRLLYSDTEHGTYSIRDCSCNAQCFSSLLYLCM